MWLIRAASRLKPANRTMNGEPRKALVSLSAGTITSGPITNRYTEVDAGRPAERAQSVRIVKIRPPFSRSAQ